MAGADNDIVELGVGIERIVEKILSPLGASLIRFKIQQHSQPTLQWSPTALSSQPLKKFHRVSAIWMAKEIAAMTVPAETRCWGRFIDSNDRGVDRINGGIELLPVGCVGHSVMGFVSESSVDIEVNKGLAFLEGSSELANGEFVLARADVFLDVFFGRHGYLLNR